MSLFACIIAMMPLTFECFLSEKIPLIISSQAHAVSDSRSSLSGSGEYEGKTHKGRSPTNLLEFFKIYNNHGSIKKSSRTKNRIEVIYEDGWKEIIKNGLYRLQNPNNEMIFKRKARSSDYERLNSVFE